MDYLFVATKSAKSQLISSKSMGKSIPPTQQASLAHTFGRNQTTRPHTLPTMQRLLVSFLPIQFLWKHHSEVVYRNSLNAI